MSVTDSVAHEPGPIRSDRDRPRVVHVTTTDVSLELLLGPQLEAIAQAGYEVIGASAPGPYVDPLAQRGIEHVPLRHATRAMAPGRDLLALAELRSLFRRLRPDVVHTHNPKPGVYGRMAAKAAGVPVVVNTVHGLYAQPDDPWRRRAVVYGLERVAGWCSDAELVQNPEDVPVLERIGVAAHKVHLLGNGIDLDRFDPARVEPATAAAVRAELGAGPDDLLVGAVGRLVWEKGVREVLDAARRARARDPRIRFVLIGPADPDKSDGLSREDITRAEADGIVFAGNRSDMEAVYAALDLYVLASYREGWPRSAMEASAMGLPVIATDIRGCRQVVEPERTGLLVPVRDGAALADAVCSLAADAEVRTRMGDAGRALARDRFDQQHQIATTLATYARLLERRRP